MAWLVKLVGICCILTSEELRSVILYASNTNIFYRTALKLFEPSLGQLLNYVVCLHCLLDIEKTKVDTKGFGNPVKIHDIIGF